MFFKINIGFIKLQADNLKKKRHTSLEINQNITAILNIIFYAYCGFNPKNGGAERVSDMLAKEFARIGHNVFFITWHSGSYDAGYAPIAPQLTLPGQKRIDSPKNIAAFTAFVEENRADVIICQHSYDRDFALLPYYAKQKTGVKVLYPIHTTPRYGTLTIEAATESAPVLKSEKRFSKQFRRTTRIIFKQQKLKSRLKKTAEQLNLLNNIGDGIVLLSERYIPVVQEIAGIRNAAKLFGIGNPNTYSLSKINISEKENTLLFVGRLSTEKRPEKAMLLWQHIQHQFPDWNLKIVGGGILEEDLKLLKDELKLERCFLEGRQDPKRYYEKAKILLLASDMEGFPMAMTEAMQHGVVPVVFNTFEASSDMIEDDVTGISVTPYDLDEFEKKLTALMRDEEKRAEMAEKGRVSVERFALPNIIKQWENVFEKIM